MPSPTYTWLLNGQILPSSTSNVYAIFGIIPSDVGVYQCVSENIVGKILSRKAELKFYGEHLRTFFSNVDREAGAYNAEFLILWTATDSPC